MTQLYFVTANIVNYLYNVTVWNRETGKPEVVEFNSKKKLEKLDLLKLWNKANKNENLTAVDSSIAHNGFTESRYKLELSKFIESATKVEDGKRPNCDCISRNIINYLYKVTVWNRETAAPEVIEFNSKKKLEKLELLKLWNKANTNDNLTAVDCNEPTESSALYYMTIDKFLDIAEPIEN